MATKTVTSLTRPAQNSTALSLYELRGNQSSGGITGGATLDSAIDALSANRVRSFLTMFGIAWGVGSLLLLVGLGEGKDDLAPFEPKAFVDALLGADA